MTRFIYAVFFCFWILNGYAWNATGHQIVAQIAYDNLSPAAKRMCHRYLGSSASSAPNERFVASSTWMDQIKSRKISWFDITHYINTPFSIDGTPNPPVKSTNAIWAIKHAAGVLSSKNAKTKEKRLALRMLIHIVGDIHQPLHAITRVSARFPKGDLGGNLMPLGKNPLGSNLHQYWDNGAGIFLGYFDANRIKQRARQLEQKMPCNQLDVSINPEKWSKMSYKLAVEYVYQLQPYDVPSVTYRKQARVLAQKQVVYAGCRLAAVLNNIG